MKRPSHVVVFDFDGTLISKKYISCFTVMDNSLAPKYRQELDKLRAELLPKVKDGKLSPEEIKKWVFRSIEIYTEARLTLYKIAKTLSIVDLRPEIVETLNFLAQKEIPTAIISYGITAFIETILENHNIKSYIAKIYAIELVTKDGLLYGCQPETIVTVATKGICSKNFADRYGVPVENILAVGDSSVDQYLGGLQTNRLGIAESENDKKQIEKYFGEVIITENFGPVLDWLKKKLKPPNAVFYFK